MADARATLPGPRAPAAAIRGPAVFAVAAGAFQAAAHARSPLERWYRIGALPLRLCFAGPALLPAICPALDHLAAPPSPQSALTVLLWDQASTGAPPPLLPPEAPPAAEREQVYAAYQQQPPALSVLWPATGQAAYWVPDAALPWSERAAPLRILLQWWLSGQGVQLVHGAAVGDACGAVVLAGPGGAGKSTTALACLAHGLDYLGDDFVLVADAPAPRAASLYNSAKVGATELGAFAGLPLRPAGVTPEGKAVCFLQQDAPARLRRELPLRAVLVPVIRGGRTSRLEPISGVAALRALAPTTIVLLRGAGAASLAIMARAVRHTPCYRLELGTDLAAVAACVRDALDRAPSDGCPPAGSVVAAGAPREAP